jgi:hypothetical protein
MKPILKFAIALVAIFSVFIATACPKKDAVRKSAEASYRLPALTNDVIAKIDEALSKGLIDVAQAKQAGGLINPIAKAEVTFVALVRSAHAIVKQTGQLPADMAGRIRAMLDDEIIKPFLDLLAFHNLLPENARAVIAVAVAALKVVLTTIGTGFGSTLLNLLKNAAVLPGPIPPIRTSPIKLESVTA